MLASKSGHVEVVDKLLQHGSSVDLQNKVELCMIVCIMKTTKCKSSSL